MKLCSMCNIKKPIDSFAVNSANLDGKDYWCKPCRSSYHKAKYPRSMKKMYKDKTHKQCRKCEEIKLITAFPLRGGSRITYCKECSYFIGSAANLKKLGLTVDEYISMFEDQKGLCYICNKEEPSHTKKRLSVDHDHRCCGSGKACKKCIRRLLCSQCNMALGAVKDEISTLKNMISYLENH